jgi:FRG domain
VNKKTQPKKNKHPLFDMKKKVFLKVWPEYMKMVNEARDNPRQAIRIASVQDFLSALDNFKPSRDFELFYRGQSDIAFNWYPSVYRNKGWINSERELILDTVRRNSELFLDSECLFQKLVRMQHFGVPTRLLDITSNPLVALYFACNAFADKHGEVWVLRVPRDSIKYWDSDTVSLISHIALMPMNFEWGSWHKETAKTSANKKSYSELLVNQIRREKPYFENRINHDDLDRSLCVLPKLDNPRVIRQLGAFILFGIFQTKKLPSTIASEWHVSFGRKRLLIESEAKSKILQQLYVLGISEETLFPGIENVARDLKNRHLTTEPRWSWSPSKAVKAHSDKQPGKKV